MKEFKKFALLLLIIIAGINILSRLIIPSKSKLYFEPIDNLRKIKFFVFGDSHAQNSWGDFTSNNLINLSFEGDNIVDIERKINFLFRNDYLDSTSVLILPIDPYIFSEYRLLNNQNSYSSTFYNNGLCYAYFTYYLPFIYDSRFKFDIYKLIKHKSNSAKCREGELKLKTHEDSLWINKRLKTIYPQPNLERELLDSYQRILQLLEEIHAFSFFIKYPVSPYFSHVQQDMPNAIKFQTAIDSFSKKENIIIIDLSDSISNNNLFYNGDHLNCLGSEDFIRIIKKHIRISL